MEVHVTIGNAKVSLSWDATDATDSYKVMRSTVIDGAYTLVSSVTTLSFIDETVSNNSTYYYRIISTNSIGDGLATEPVAAIMNAKFTGTIIGTEGSRNNDSKSTKFAAMDNNLSSYFDANITDGAWVGIDLGRNTRGKLGHLSYAPRSTRPGRMVGGMFQGANNADFSDAITFYTVTDSPETGLLTDESISDTRLFRYFRYLSPGGGSGNIAEVEFWGTIVNLLDQTITFNTIEAKEVGDIDFDPGAITSSGLPISYSSSDTSIATIVSGKVHLVSEGSCTIFANQKGDATYGTAVQASQLLTINSLLGINNLEKEDMYDIYPNPVIDKLIITVNSAERIKTELYNISGILLISKVSVGNKTSLDMSGMVSGFYIMKIMNGNNIILRKVIKE